MAKRKSLTETIIEMTPEDISTKDISELRRYYKALRTTIGKRRSAFDKADLYSYAIEGYDKSVAQNPNIPLKKMTINRLRREVMYAIKALTGETSTVAGAREVYREQDIRIFGQIPGTNLPEYTMSKAERKAYWDEYDEWRGNKDIQALALESDQQQTALADIFFGGLVKRELFESDLKGTEAGQELIRFTEIEKASRGQALLNYLTSIKHEKERQEFRANVYTGSGSDF